MTLTLISVLWNNCCCIIIKNRNVALCCARIFCNSVAASSNDLPDVISFNLNGLACNSMQSFDLFISTHCVLHFVQWWWSVLDCSLCTLCSVACMLLCIHSNYYYIIVFLINCAHEKNLRPVDNNLNNEINIFFHFSHFFVIEQKKNKEGEKFVW